MEAASFLDVQLSLANQLRALILFGRDVAPRFSSTIDKRPALGEDER